MTQSAKHRSHKEDKTRASRPFHAAAGALLALALAGRADAAVLEDRSRWSIGLEAGMASPLSPSTFKADYKDGSSVGLSIRQEFSSAWALAGSFATQTHKRETASDQNLRTQPITLLAYRSFLRTYAWNPYLVFGGGVSRNKRTVFTVRENWTKITGAAGIGVEYDPHAIATLGLEFLWRYFGGASSASKDFQTATLSATLHFHIPESWIPEKPAKPLSMKEIREEANQEIEQDTDLQIAQGDIEKVLREIEAGRLPPITFEPELSTIQNPSFEALSRVGQVLSRFPGLNVRVEVNGNAAGSDGALPEARAEAVKNYLSRTFSLDEARLSTSGKPAPATETDGLARAHAVQFHLSR